MKHPFSGKSLVIYFMAWAALIAAYTFLLYFLFEYSLVVAVSDSVMHNLPLVGLGLGFWYVVNYLSPKDNGGLTSLVVNLCAAVLIAVALTSYASYSLLNSLFPGNGAYMVFLVETLPWRIFIGALVMAVIVMIYYLLKYNQNLQQKEEEEIQLQTLLKQSELDMLKFQINPHFIFNSLNSISALTLTEPGKAREMVIKLSEFLRSSLGKDNTELRTIKEELERMELYMDIEKVRFGDRLKVASHLDVKCNEMQVPNMILQPLYENAIKYGVYEQLDEVAVETYCHCESGNLHVRITNSYDCQAIPQKGKGIGLKNVRNRLDLIYGIPDLVTIEKDQEKFSVHLVIPQQNAGAIGRRE